MIKEKMKRYFLVLLFLMTFFILFVLNRLLMPKFVLEVKEGSLIEEYYRSSQDHDVIFIGDCEVFESFIPSLLEETYQIKSFVRGSAGQRLWQSYALMKETLRYETPKIFVLSVQELMYGENAKEEYNRMTFDGMRWSKEKIDGILEAMNPEEHFIEYVFPLLRYKERIFSLKKEDFTYLFRKPLISDRGYLKNTGVKPLETLPPVKPLGDYTLPERAVFALERMTDLCEKEGIRLILIKAPIPYPYWYEEWEKQVKEYAKEHSLLYLNFLTLQKETGIDLRTDTYDAGLHLNLNGATKLTIYLGKILNDLLQAQ